MILCSQVGCLLSALLLVLMAEWKLEALFIGTGAMGYFISLQFASGLDLCRISKFSNALFSGFSWLSKHMDMAGKLSSIPSLGANFGLMSLPPVAGVIFFSWIGPMGIYYLTLGNLNMHRSNIFLNIDI